MELIIIGVVYVIGAGLWTAKMGKRMASLTFWIVTGSMVYVLTLYLCRLPVHRFFEREKS